MTISWKAESPRVIYRLTCCFGERRGNSSVYHLVNNSGFVFLALSMRSDIECRIMTNVYVDARNLIMCRNRVKENLWAQSPEFLLLTSCLWAGMQSEQEKTWWKWLKSAFSTEKIFFCFLCCLSQLDWAFWEVHPDLIGSHSEQYYVTSFFLLDCCQLCPMGFACDIKFA